VCGLSALGLFVWFAFFMGVGHGPSEQTKRWLSAHEWVGEWLGPLVFLLFAGFVIGGLVGAISGWQRDILVRRSQGTRRRP
jgi:hypothetical protein